VVRQVLTELGSKSRWAHYTTPRKWSFSVAGSAAYRRNEAPELLSTLRRIESRGALETIWCSLKKLSLPVVVDPPLAPQSSCPYPVRCWRQTFASEFFISPSTLMRSSFVIRLRLLMILRAAFELNLSVQFQSTGFLPSSLNVKLNSPGGRHCGNQVKLTRIVWAAKRGAEAGKTPSLGNRMERSLWQREY